MVLHAAEGGRCARIGHRARVQALPVDAGGVRRALAVVRALRRQWWRRVRLN